jgi:hypothetical protein
VQVYCSRHQDVLFCIYVGLPKISHNLIISRKPLAPQTCAAIVVSFCIFYIVGIVVYKPKVTTSKVTVEIRT